MNKSIKIFIACFFFIIFSNSENSWSSNSSKRYYIDDIQINAKILIDGSLKIEESRTYGFRGSYKWADYSIPLQQLGKVTDFSLIEGDNEYSEGYEKTPGTYNISQDDNEFYVKWFYRAKNESRTFTLKYRIEDAVIVHDDVAEFYYKFLRAGRPKSTGSVQAVLTLPQPATTTDVQAWMHSSLNGEYEFVDSKIHFVASPLPRKNHFEARVIFPNSWIPSALKKSGEIKHSQIMEEERQLVEQSNLLREKAKQKDAFREKYSQTVYQWNIILAVLGLAIFLLLYQKFGRAHPVPFRSKLHSDIPENISPAVANYIFSSQQIGAGAMVATLMDLAQREILKIEERVTEKKFIFTTKKTEYILKLNQENYSKDKNNLTSHEKDLIEFIFDKIANGASEIQMSAIRKAGNKVIKWFRQWKKLIKEEWGNKPFYDKSSYKGIVISAIVASLIETVGILTIIFFGITGLIATISGVVLFGLSFAILRYTKEVKLMRTKLQALRRYLVKYEFRKDTALLQTNFEKYFVYGVALGIGTKAIKELMIALPDWQHSTYFPWYIGALGHNSPVGFANAVSSMVTVASTTMGSAAGVGGGASAGGGGGAGGAGGGAG
jgi:uncharacterized membrane protein